MYRTNTFDVDPRTAQQETLLRRLLDASAALWNEVTYARRQQFFNSADAGVWDVSTAPLYDEYKSVLSAATAQTIIRQSDQAWRSFFELRDAPAEDPTPPGYWGNESDGRELRTVIRTDRYTVQWGERSRVELPVGTALKEAFGLGRTERLRLPVRGTPAWEGDQGRLVIESDDVADTYRTYQSMTVPDDRCDAPTGAETAALDIGANTLVACATTTGRQYCYDGQRPFAQFEATTREIAAAKAKLPPDVDTSRRTDRLDRGNKASASGLAPEGEADT